MLKCGNVGLDGEAMTDDIKLWLPPMLTLLGTLIVVTFTAWLNTRAVGAKIDTLNGRIDGLDGRVNDFKETLGTRITDMEKTLGNRIDGLDGRVNDFKEMLGNRIIDMEKTLGNRIDGLDGRVTDVKEMLGNRITDMEKTLGNRITETKEMLGNRITDTKETLRAESRATAAELTVTLQRIENKLDHYTETQAGHSEDIRRLKERG